MNTTNTTWNERQTARGLQACPACKGTGCQLTAELAAAFDLAHDGCELPAIEATFCARCNGLGWLQAATFNSHSYRQRNT